MATEYGIRRDDGTEAWKNSAEQAERIAKFYGYTLIAREVSEPRIVSIRA